MTLKFVAVAIVGLVLAVALYVRFAPIRSAAYHIDNVGAALAAGKGGNFSIGDGGDSPAVETALTVDEAAEALEAVILATPRTRLLAGSLAGEGDSRVASYVTRSALMGYPDITTVQLEPSNGGSRILMIGRQVYGLEDFGVNEARLRAWISAIDGG